MTGREKFEVAIKIVPVVISIFAFLISLAGYNLAFETNERNKERLSFARKNYPSVADYVLVDGKPSSFIQHYSILVSNSSLIPITITHCSRESRISNENSVFAGGNFGQSCTGEFKKDGKTVSLPFLLPAGDTVGLEFDEEWTLTTQQLRLFEVTGDLEKFYQLDCQGEDGKKMYLYISPSSSCLPSELRSQAGEVFLQFGTGRGETFDTKDIRWWLG